ncbi:hypothetical protein F750_3906 [Streptomyces sp. PAMC 26508]|nr:hypothetical protein F750_3906 [Streptomyces sp. PAMC 26508]
MGYSAAKRIRAKQPPGPFVLSERCYGDVSTSSAVPGRGAAQ